MLEILNELRGIIGTVVGVILTLLFTEIKRRIGKISLNIKEIDFEYQKLKFHDKLGRYTGEKVIYSENPNQFEYSVEMVFYNSSEIPRSLYDIKIVLSTEKGKDFEHIPQDRNHNSKIGIIDIEPHRLNKISICGQITKDEFEELNRLGEVKKIYFKGLNYKEKIFKKKII